MANVSVIVNKDYINKTVGQAVLKKAISNIEKTVLQEVNLANQELLKKFLEHEITREIKQGASANSSSLPSGNLFSFLGFEKGSDPVGELASFLTNSIEIKSIRKLGNLSINIQIKIPTLNEIEQISQLPWITKSWVKAIESGISGLGYYLYSEKGFDKSRSSTGIQVSKAVFGGGFKAQKYMSQILNDISKKLIQDIKSNLV